MAVKKRILEQTYGQCEKLFLIRAFDESKGNITLAARSVGMKRSNFSALLKKHGLSLNPCSSPGQTPAGKRMILHSSV
jgi:transcriptional regulator of acetoin/glycerol metabolism